MDFDRVNGRHGVHEGKGKKEDAFSAEEAVANRPAETDTTVKTDSVSRLEYSI